MSPQLRHIVAGVCVLLAACSSEAPTTSPTPTDPTAAADAAGSNPTAPPVEAPVDPTGPEADADRTPPESEPEPRVTPPEPRISEETSAELCAPCNDDQDCEHDTLCRQVADSGRWACLAACNSAASDCPIATTCATVDTELLCIPDADECECDETHVGRSGRCDAGSVCAGAYTCEADGPTECTVEKRSEQCNGIDDDCDGKIDEGGHTLCDDGSTCTAETCTEGACVYQPSGTGCMIGVNCFTTGTAKPDDACLWCDPKTSGTGWSARPDGLPCDDGLLCTVGDACAAGSCAPTSAMSCDDSNACTEDACDPATGCVHTPLDLVGCDDADPCTTTDSCQAGACVGVPMVCDDGLSCTIDVCEDGECDTQTLETGWCLIDEVCRTEGTTPAGVPCLTCAPDVDATVWSPRPDGAACDDGNACTGPDTCAGGVCLADSVACDDGNDCTLDFCLPTFGCLQQAVAGLLCSDGNACTTTDTCLGGDCVGSDPPVCDDDNPCTEDGCDPATGCAFTATESAETCDDGDSCTTTDTCADGSCQGAAVVCDDGVACTTDACTDGACTHEVEEGACLIDGACFENGDADPNDPCARCWHDAISNAPPGSPCNDSDACTAGEKCQGGSCLGGAPVSCDDENPCTDDACDTTLGCLNTPNIAGCNDGLFCTVDDTCTDGICAGAPRDCTALDAPCAAGSCSDVDAACVAIPATDGSVCDDGLPCSGPDTCQEGACQGPALAGCCTVAADCDDGNACTADQCTPEGTCSYDVAAVDGAGCDDGAWCTVDDVCASGSCVGAPRSCASDACNDGYCDPDAGACMLAPKPDGLACEDDGEACTSDTCQTGACAHTTVVAPCDDANACTFNDTCTDSGCAGTSYSCDDGLACTEDSCAGDGSCANTVAAGACLIGGACVAEGTLHPTQACQRCHSATDATAWTASVDGWACDDDGDVCTDDVCQAGACAHPAAPPATACDDGDACTQGDNCGAGDCAGTPYTCDDGLPCTADACDGAGGCTAPLVAGFCLVDDACYADTMLDPANACRVCDAATPTQFSDRPNGTSCDDTNACSSADACDAGVCKGSTIDCDDNNLCTDDACDPATGCINNPNSNPCSDGLYCTVNDVCSAGSCSGTLRDCTGVADACNDGACDEAGDACVPAPLADGTPCDDTTVCTGPDSCQGGACQGAPVPACCTADSDCDDANACTADSCNVATGACTNSTGPLDGAGCDDGAFCTTGDTCGAGVCTGAPRDCSALDGACSLGVCNDVSAACEAVAANEGMACPGDGNGCTDDVCQGGACAHPNNSAACDDGAACTFSDTCNSGSCAGTPYSCDDGMACTTDTCDGAGACNTVIDAGVCAIGGVCRPAGEALPGEPCRQCDPATSQIDFSAISDGSACSDGDACTAADTCTSMVCDGASVNCDDGDVCTTDACDPVSGCSNTPNTASCDDGVACTFDDTCSGGSCGGTSYACDDGLACTTDACDGAGGCTTTIDADSCLISGQCWADGANDPAQACRACTTGTSQTAWTIVPDGTACDDGDACTAGEVCSAGGCSGGANTCPCAGKVAGESCDDGDGSTIGDLCLQDQCAGFEVHVVSPSGADEKSFLTQVMYTGGAFHAIGGDKSDGWIATVVGSDVNVVAS